MFNVLTIRYLLMYFPQLAFLTVMVRKMTKPILFLIVVLFAFLFGLAVIMYSLYSTKVAVFRNGLTTLLSVGRFALGGLMNWRELADYYPLMFCLLMILGLVFLTLMLQALPIAIFVSH